MLALAEMCEGHTDAAYIASRRMAPHLCIPHTLCSVDLMRGEVAEFKPVGSLSNCRHAKLDSHHKRKRGEVGEYGAIRRAAM
jgi:hypothetical protein